MANPVNVFRGDTIKGTATLRVLDPVDPTKMNNYVIPSGATIQMNFPGISPAPSVTIDTASSEIVIITASLGQISWTLSNTKSLLLNIGKKQAIDLIVTELSGDTTTFEKMQILNISDRANP